MRICCPADIQQKIMFKVELANQEINYNIVGDYVVALARKSPKNLYPGELRFVRAIDPETEEVIDFITNNFGLLEPEIANIYRHCWNIEVFFR